MIPIGFPSLPTVPTSDTIAYIFRFVDLAQAQADMVVGPLMTPGGSGEELLVFTDVTVNSVTPETGFWLLLTSKGGVNSSLYFSSNIELCFDLNRINSTTAILGSNIDTTHVCMVVDNFGSFIQNGIRSPLPVSPLLLEDGLPILLEDGKRELGLEA